MALKVLRHPMAKSSLSEMSEGTEFKPLLSFFSSELPQKKSLIFCCGKVHYDIQELLSKNAELKAKTTLIAIEELFPFPEPQIKALLAGVSKEVNSVWVQEEPLNSGAYAFVEPRISRVLRELGVQRGLKYCGRRSLACPAIGHGNGHKRESKEIIDYLVSLLGK